MVRLLDKEMIIKVLMQRPAFIKNMKRPDDEFLARCIMANTKVNDHIDKTWLTLPVLQNMIPLFIKSRWHRTDYLEEFPEEVRAALSEKEINKLCDKEIDYVIHFPNAPYRLWLKRVKAMNWLDFDKIPVQHRTENLLTEYFIAHHGSSEDIPIELFTDKLIDRILDKNPDMINDIPEQFVTQTRLERAFRTLSTISLDKELPEVAWNQTNADLVMGNCENFQYIPNQYKNKDMCLKAVESDGNNLDYVPKNFVDEGILLMALTSTGTFNENNVPKRLLTKSLLMKLAQKDRERCKDPKDKPNGVKSYLTLTGKIAKDLDEDVWVKILKIIPVAIRLIDKPAQTDAIINAFIENASIEVIDYIVSHQLINLTKLKKEHTPLLLASTVPALQDLIARKLNPPVRKKIVLPDQIQSGMNPDVSKQELSGITQTGTQAEVDITDRELLEITQKFGK